MRGGREGERTRGRQEDEGTTRKGWDGSKGVECAEELSHKEEDRGFEGERCREGLISTER